MDPQLPDDYCWLTLAQIRELVRSSDFVSDESRSILSLALAAVYANGHSSEPEIALNGVSFPTGDVRRGHECEP